MAAKKTRTKSGRKPAAKKAPKVAKKRGAKKAAKRAGKRRAAKRAGAERFSGFRSVWVMHSGRGGVTPDEGDDWSDNPPPGAKKKR